jgi:tripartite-type tricarboxylate transporter receptor subunit TctC
MFMAAAFAIPLRAADAWPSQPIKIVVPFGPGSGTDTATRVLAQHLQVALKQTVTVENRAGANGSIAAAAVARAAPDGMTLLMGTNSTHGANPGLMARLGYDPARDFTPLGMVATFSSVLVVHPSVPVRTAAELVAYAKANPKALSFAAGNTSSLIMGEMFARRSGVELLRVPYTSNPAGLIDVIAGRVQLMFPDIASSQAHVRSGALRALGTVTIGGRSPLMPDMPTVAEAAALPDFNFIGWIGLFAPQGTPEPVLNRLAEETEKILALPEVRQQLLQLGAETRWMGPSEFRPFVRSELTRLPRLLLEIGVQPQ